MLDPWTVLLLARAASLQPRRNERLHYQIRHAPCPTTFAGTALHCRYVRCLQLRHSYTTQVPNELQSCCLVAICVCSVDLHLVSARFLLGFVQVLDELPRQRFKRWATIMLET